MKNRFSIISVLTLSSAILGPVNGQANSNLFECSVGWLKSNDKVANNFNNNAVQAAISDGCGPGVPAGYYPDLTVKNAYCYCTGTAANGNYQRLGSGQVWDIWLQGNNQWLPGSRSDGVLYGQGGLYGTNGSHESRS